MVDEISDFFSPTSPGVNPEGLYHNLKKNGQLGENLFHEASHFYSWYKSMKHPNDTQGGENHLIIMMQIADISKRQGCMTSFQEENTISQIQELRESLHNGQLRMHQIPETLQKILNTLIENNPKIKLISHLTKIEISCNLSNTIPEELKKEINDTTVQIIDKISPQMADIKAEKANRHLEKFLETHPSPEAILEEFKDNILPLLK